MKAVYRFDKIKFGHIKRLIGLFQLKIECPADILRYLNKDFRLIIGQKCNYYFWKFNLKLEEDESIAKKNASGGYTEAEKKMTSKLVSIYYLS